MQKYEIEHKPDDQPAIARIRAMAFWNRRTLIAIIILATAALAVLVSVRSAIRESDPSDTVITVATRAGEIRRIILPDGSLVTLHGDTRLSYRAALTDSVRLVRLETGRAFFDTVEGPRAFVVQTDHARVRASGDRFVVRAGEGQTVVIVVEGRVTVRSTAIPDVGVTLQADEMSVCRAGMPASPPVTVAPDSALKWIPQVE